jgi:hypothetical protein
MRVLGLSVYPRHPLYLSANLNYRHRSIRLSARYPLYFVLVHLTI